MKKIIALVMLTALALSGCASGSFLGLATTGYVDTKTKDLQAQQAAQIDQLKAQLEESKALMAEAKAAVEQVNQTKKTIEDLQGIAKKAEERIASIPKEVIKQIIDILQAALTQ